MARPPVWRYTLEEARRQALVAVDFYNRPGDRRNFLDFIVHMHLAWQNLLHADRIRKKLEIYYREKDGRRFIRLPDGSKKTYDLRECLKLEFEQDSPLRANVEFFIGLRNRVEHRFQDLVMNVTEPQTHAYIINFEAELTKRFGQEQSLSGELRFPVYVQTLTPRQYEEQQDLRRELPLTAANYITEFEAGLPRQISEDDRFAYRLLLLPMKGPKSEADLALNFVNRKDLSDSDLRALRNKEATLIITEKVRNVLHGDEMLPGALAEAVEEQLPFRFSVNDFTALRKEWQIGPVASGSKEQLPKSHDYCLYSPAFSQFVYRPALIPKIIKAVGTPEKYRKRFGRAPKGKDKE